MKPKQKLGLAAGAALSLGAAWVLIVNALPDGPSYYVPVADVNAGKPAPQTVVRVGGKVKPGSLRQQSGRQPAALVLTDGAAELAVSAAKPLPAVLREGDDAVAEGRIVDGVLLASSVIPRFDDPLKGRR